MSLVLATRNAHKVREFERLLPGVAIEPLPDSAPTPEETGTTFAENALIKARSAAEATGKPAFADDSGVEAEALDWRPGVYSARFAGPDATDGENLAKLHREAPAGSRARYVCVIAHVTPEGDEQLFEGRCEGTLAAEPGADVRAARVQTPLPSPSVAAVLNPAAGSARRKAKRHAQTTRRPSRRCLTAHPPPRRPAPPTPRTR